MLLFIKTNYSNIIFGVKKSNLFAIQVQGHKVCFFLRNDSCKNSLIYRFK